MGNKWISFDVHYCQGQACYYGPGLYWVTLPDWFTVENTENFKREVFRFILDLAKRQKPVLTYEGKP